YVYAEGSAEFKPEPWMQVVSPEVLIRFPVGSLVARRSFIFARAGFGKSNLIKLLFSELYRNTPTVEKRGGQKVPVGTVLLDPDGEYFWPEDKGRPGLCDVPHLEDKLVVFTSRKPPSPYYGSFVASDIRLDIRRLRPADVISIALDPERQEQQNVRKLRGLNDRKWAELVDMIHREGHSADLQRVSELLELE
ncbi:ATPase, partial [Thermus scotoductus]